ncbi:MAG: DUF1501 domain-containing protein [Gemmataceae bacterium]
MTLNSAIHDSNIAFSRRELLQRLGGGVGTLGLAALLAPEAAAARVPHFQPKAKRVIHLFMNGGPFGPDFLDPKPAITKFAGQRPKEVNLRTERPTGGLLDVPFKYKKYGASGLEISELLPYLSRHADDLCVLRSVYGDNPNHGPALFMMNSGVLTPNRPSLGAWLTYGLGSENADLPAFVVLCPGRPVRFAELWASAFLPSEFQGTYMNHSNLDPRVMVPNLRAALGSSDQRKQLDLLQELNRDHAAARGGDPALEARIQTMETAFRMQTAASDAFDVNREPERVRDQYGRSHFGNACLLARRLAERGVRITQIYYGNGQPWDTHGNHNAATRVLASDMDRAAGALIGDLKNRGLLDDTLVMWGGEFGRTPTTEGGDGRDHNHHGFTMFLAGGGTKGGYAHGATDDFGFKAVHDKVHVHDLHATVLHLMGFDHEKLTYRHAGRDYRLTDVYGRLVKELVKS